MYVSLLNLSSDPIAEFERLQRELQQVLVSGARAVFAPWHAIPAWGPCSLRRCCYAITRRR